MKNLRDRCSCEIPGKMLRTCIARITIFEGFKLHAGEIVQLQLIRKEALVEAISLGSKLLLLPTGLQCPGPRSSSGFPT